MAAFFLGVAVTGMSGAGSSCVPGAVGVLRSRGAGRVLHPVARVAPADSHLRPAAPAGTGVRRIPLLVLLNGASPYLGLKTRAASRCTATCEPSCAGKVIVESLVVPSSLKLAGFRRTWCGSWRPITATSPPGAQRRVSPYYEFRRHISEVARRGATDQRHLSSRRRPSLGPRRRAGSRAFTAISLPMRKFLSFADVSAVPRQRNRHGRGPGPAERWWWARVPTASPPRSPWRDPDAAWWYSKRRPRSGWGPLRGAHPSRVPARQLSSVYPMAAASPFLRELPLAAHGLAWVDPPAPLANLRRTATRRCWNGRSRPPSPGWGATGKLWIPGGAVREAVERDWP